MPVMRPKGGDPMTSRKKTTHHIPLCALQSLNKIKMSKLFTTALSCLLALNAFAQFKISGSVRDSKTNTALVGASVQIENLRGTATDEQGYFELKNVAGGKQTLVVRFLGFSEEKKEIYVTGDLSLEFLLNESTQLTDEVVVYATRAN